LALAGGGTRGAYHLGAWKALNEMGIEVGAVVGTSIGSVNGAMFVQGDLDKAEALWKSIKIEDVFDLDIDPVDANNLFDHKNLVHLLQELIRKKGLQTMPFLHTLKEVIDEEKIRNSEIEYGLNTTSVSEIESIELFIENIPQGKLLDCIMASSCFPGFQQIYIEDKAYADGGIMNNLPLDMLFKKGYKNIIAVNVGGVGIIRNTNGFDTNIVRVKCQKPHLGILEFDKELIEKSIKQAYFDTYKEFGRLVGRKYFFNTMDYYRAKAKFSDEILAGLEYAAEYFGINNLAVYRVDALAKGVVEKYNALKKKYEIKDNVVDSGMIFRADNVTVVIKLTQMILENRAEGLNNKLIMGVLKNRLLAANAIAYFLNR